MAHPPHQNATLLVPEAKKAEPSQPSEEAIARVAAQYEAMSDEEKRLIEELVRLDKEKGSPFHNK